MPQPVIVLLEIARVVDDLERMSAIVCAHIQAQPAGTAQPDDKRLAEHLSPIVIRARARAVQLAEYLHERRPLANDPGS